VETAQEPRLSNAALPRDAVHKAATVVVNTIQEVTPESVQFLSPADKLVPTASF
jgi:hypothetical protein